MEHFMNVIRHKIGGRAKAMVVTPSRLHAVRYVQKFKRQIKEKGLNDLEVLVAFSGEVKVILSTQQKILKHLLSHSMRKLCSWRKQILMLYMT